MTLRLILGFGVCCIAAYCGIVLWFMAHQDAVRAREEREMREADDARNEQRRIELRALSLNTGGLAQAIADYEANEIKR